jgi:hypothetical protein
LYRRRARSSFRAAVGEEVVEVTKRELALRVLISQIGVHEKGESNRGPVVDEYQRADTLPGEGYAWCMSLQQWCWRMATGGELLADGTAGCATFFDWAHRSGYLVDRPLRGDHVLFDLDGDRQYDDHVGMVERVLGLGPVLLLQTIEGNTSPDERGDQADGGGVWRKRRAVRRSTVAFVRVPGDAPEGAVEVPRPKRPPGLRGLAFGLRRAPSGIIYTEPTSPPEPVGS